ncbi:MULTISPECIES: transglutaminase-like domain-containing protein [unclassified Enterococcus]|uniref:transglutaminase-like domain-containing protein n=1 Tax=unclassified Enterococcus TaxID=2608891 RepID=UPI003D2AA4F9
MTHFKINWLRGLLYFLLAAIAIPPFLQANTIARSFPMFAAAGLITIASLVIQSKLLRLPVYALIVLGTLYTYFPLKMQVSFAWLQRFFEEVAQEIQQLFVGELGYIPEKTSLFLLLLLLFIFAVLMIDYHLWPLPIIVILGYFMSLAVFRNFDLTKETIFLLVLLCYYLFFQNLDFSLLHSRYFWIGNLILLFLFAVSMLLPASFPEINQYLEKRSEPVRTFFNKEGLYDTIKQYQLTQARTGFSEHDEQLGGPLYENNEVVFTAKQENESYWKVENKSIYTGNGWTEEEAKNIVPIDFLPYSLNSFESVTSDTAETIELSLDPSLTYLPFAYGNFQLKKIQESHPPQFYFMPDTQRFIIGTHEIPLTIELEVARLDADREKLASIELSPADLEAQKDNLQLPENLPERISDLAEEITASSATLLEKTEAIEKYLNVSGDFRYSRIDTPHTPSGRDYVDYFLFDSKVGYCDNFSSAMVVLLRTLDIPARWTKGFSTGTRTENDEESTYTIRNSHAHSWPEVFFPGVGWIPFEPTTTFTGPAGTTADTPASEETTATETSEAETSESAAADGSSSETESASETEEETAAAPSSFSQNGKRIFQISVFILIAVGLLFFWKKFTWLTYWVYLHFFTTSFQNAYRKLLTRCEKRMPRTSSESLSRYSEQFESVHPLDGKFIQLTKIYEQAVYGIGEPELAVYKNDFDAIIKKMLKEKNKRISDK